MAGKKLQVPERLRQVLRNARVRRNRWIMLGLASILLRLAWRPFPEVAEVIYSRGFYALIRWIMDNTIGWLPFSSLLLLLGFIAWRLIRRLRRPRPKRSLQKKLGLAAHNIASLAGGFIFIFYFIWGFNYDRIDLEQQLGIQAEPMAVEDLCYELEWAGRQAAEIRATIPGATGDSLSPELIPYEMESFCREAVVRALEDLDFPAFGRVRVRRMPPGMLLRFGVAGIYNPFTGEGNVDNGLTPQQLPFTMMHEMAHGYGFGDEGSCNFLAILSSFYAEDPFVRYSGRLSYFSYIARELARLDPLMYKMVRQTMPPGIRADLRANYFNNRKYRGWISKAGQQVNNAYLHMQGVREGIRSYDRVVGLFSHYRKTRGKGGIGQPRKRYRPGYID